MIQERIRPFDLSRGPLLRFSLFKLEAEIHVLFMDVHHIIWDGVSSVVFLQELLDTYMGAELPAMRLQYSDYAEWQQTYMYRRLLWKRRNIGFLNSRVTYGY